MSVFLTLCNHLYCFGCYCSGLYFSAVICCAVDWMICFFWWFTASVGDSAEETCASLYGLVYRMIVVHEIVSGYQQPGILVQLSFHCRFLRHHLSDNTLSFQSNISTVPVVQL